ncbi:MAG: ABC transporter substrate-binding protein, partial [Candidatus Dormibacteraeota bacterium]|nr:ABC transporter substrate-binding protein [Candidatus Dormibacteraeota bacterium]
MRNFIRLKHSLAFLVALMAGASLLAACSSAPSASSTPTPKVQNGGTLNIGIPTAPEALDPSTEASFVGHWVFANMCYGLYGFSVKNQVVPVLATGLPTISDGGLLYTIHVRQGVRFNDGTAMTAEAVKTSLVRDKTLPTSARAAALADISSITVVNKYTVQLRLSQVDAPLTSILASRSGIVMSPTALAREGANFGNDPVCVGPFSFQSRPSLDQINLTRSKYFYGKKPAVQEVIYHVITDPATCYSDLLSGAINVAECLAPNDVKLLDSNSAYRVQQVTSDGYSMIVINVGNVAGSLKKTYGTADNPLAK